MSGMRLSTEDETVFPQYAEGLVRDVPGATSFDTDGTCCSVAEARFPNQTAPED